MHTPFAVLIGVLTVVLLGPTSSAAAAPRNDDFKRAAPVRLGITVKGNLNGATRERGEPRHGRSLAARSVWYRFRARRSGGVALGTCRSSVDTVLAVYRGRSLRSLRTVEFNNDGCGRRGGGSRVTFNARRGRTYRIAVVAFAPTGRFRLELKSAFTPPNDDFGDAVRLPLGAPVAATTRGATRELGEPGHAGGAHTVWFRLRRSAATDVELNACNGSSPSITVYSGAAVRRLREVAVTQSDGESRCGVQLAVRAGVTYRIALDGCCGGGGFRLTASAVPRPGNDDFAAATALTEGTLITATTRYATREPGEPTHALGAARTVWFQLTPAAASEVRLRACNGSEPSIRVYGGDALAGLTVVPTIGLPCEVQFSAQAGVTYRIVFEDDGRGGDFSLMASFVPRPANDDFAAGRAVAFGTGMTATTQYATREPGEPAHTPGSGPRTVWFRLNVLDAGFVRLDACVGVSPDIIVYTGDELRALSAVAGGTLTTVGGMCSVRFAATPGIYHVAAVDALEGSFHLVSEFFPPSP